MTRNHKWTLGLLVLGASMIVSYQNCGKKSGPEDLRNASSSAACRNATVVGTWNSIDAGPADVLEFFADCRGHDSFCGMDFIYPGSPNSPNVTIEVSKTNKAVGCPQSVGGAAYTIVQDFTKQPNELTVTFNGNTRKYRKQ